MTAFSGWKGKRYWLVGASEGLGRALARSLSDTGAELVLSARNTERLESLAADLAGQCHVAPCDLGCSRSVAAVSDQLGDIDGVVLIAGYYEPMSALDWAPEDIERMCDINFTGIARALGVAMPKLFHQGYGHIAFVGSLAGLRGLPGNIGYGASKAGMMHLAECMHLDLDPQHYRVQVINPGFIKTRLTDKNDFSMPFLLAPDEAAERVRKALECEKFRTDFPWQMSAWFRFLGLLPDRFYFPIVRYTTKSSR